MEIPINMWAVLAAGVSNMVIGFLWYGPIFGKPWAALMGFTPEKMETMKKRGGMGKTYFFALLGALVMAFVFAHALIFAEGYLSTRGILSGLVGAFWNWLGFVVPVLAGQIFWEGKPLKLYLINVFYYLVSLLAMSVIFEMWV